MKINLFCLLSCLILMTACNQQRKTAEQVVPSSSQNENQSFKDVHFDNAKDLVCGMPLTAGVGDTAHYQGKVYGFCSTGCKDAFVKNPAAYLAKQ
jgi:YHS domain-containing protein